MSAIEILHQPLKAPAGIKRVDNEIKRLNRKRDSQSCDRVPTAIGILLATVGAISESRPPVVLLNTSAILGLKSNAEFVRNITHYMRSIIQLS